MTVESAAAALAGTGSVLIIWSLLVVAIGGALFVYGIVVSTRSRRSRTRRKRTTSSGHRPLPPPPASRPYQPGQLAPGSLGHPAPGTYGAAGMLPSGPTAGGQPVGRNLTVPRPRALPPGPRPLALPQQAHAQPRTPYFPPAAALPAGPTAGSPPISSIPQSTGIQSATTGTTYGGGIAAIYGTPPTPAAESKPAARAERRGKRDEECARLRSECEQLTAIAAEAATSAAQAAAEATEAHADYVAAQRAADEARRAHEAVMIEASEIAAQVATLEKATTNAAAQLQNETTHAAFAAYRRGDITAEQLREVFKRAEGWTPEHEQTSRRATELRGKETELARARDTAKAAEDTAAERAHAAAAQARSMEERARTAAADARGRCAAADACEQRRRR